MRGLKRRQCFYLLMSLLVFFTLKIFILGINDQPNSVREGLNGGYSQQKQTLDYNISGMKDKLRSWKQHHVEEPNPNTGNYQYNNYPNGKIKNAIRKSSQSCTTLRRPYEVNYRNETWQVLKENSAEIYVYSAFYDDRPSVGTTPVVRIQAVSCHAPVALYCHVWYRDSFQPYITKVSIVSSGRGDKFSKKKYDQSQYACTLPTSLPIPTHVSIAMAPCRPSTIYLPINMDIRSDWDIEFGVCVAIAFGEISLNYFIEWMELNQMFGVKEFNIYDGNISSAMNDVFEYYINKGILHVFNMPPPIDDFSKKGVKLSSPGSLNDCMLRNMYRYRYIVVIDFDEFIVPHMHSNYSAMLTAIDAEKKLSSSWKSYTFRNVYYFSHFTEDITQPAYLRTVRFRTKVNKPNRYLYAPKSFIDPRTCLSLFNHFCLKRLPPDTSPWTIDVNSTMATSHHYRTCGFDKKKCSELSKDPIQDHIILKFKPELDKRVRTVLTYLGKL